MVHEVQEEGAARRDRHGMQRDAQRKEELWNAIIKSEKTYDEILTFITAGQTTEEE